MPPARHLKPQYHSLQNMRKLLFLSLSFILTLHCTKASAQEVYDMVLQSATRIVNNPTSNFSVTRVAQFKCTALTYMKGMVVKNAPDTPVSWLDTQAYYLNEFTSIFFDVILKLQGNDRKNAIYFFMNTSKKFPMWNDPDKETAESYILSGELTPFSLDTDWEKAYNHVKDELNKE